MWRRLRQKNLKTKISHWKHINLLSFHPTQEELEFLKTQKSPVILDDCDVIVFEKLFFQNVLCPH